MPALVLATVCLLPYLNKALTIDDPVYMLQARQIIKRPLHPMALDICWSTDAQCGPVATQMVGNVLMSYYLVPAANRLDPEWLAHAMQIVALWCGIVATVSLAFGFGFDRLGACAAGLLIASAPPVLAMASTAMPEILAMSLCVIGIERLLAFKRGGKTINGVISALALGLAPIARVHLVFLWPVAVVMIRDDARVFDLRSWIALPKRRWLPLLFAVIVTVTASLLIREPNVGVKPPNMFLRPEHASHNLVSYLTDWVVAMPLGLTWIVLRNRRMRLWVFPIAVGLPLFHKLLMHHPVLWTTLTMGIGAAVLVDILLWAFQSHDLRRIVCVLWLMIPLATLPYTHLPVKYLVPCAPAAALLIADVLPAFRWPKAALVGIVAVGTIFGSMVLRADANFAEMGRKAADHLITPQVATGHRVWFASQWGFYWYALKAGGQVLRNHDVPAPGDYLVRGEIEGWPTTLPRLPRAVLINALTIGGPGGRTMSVDDGAGLYSNNYGDLMWAWGTEEWNRYELWQFQ
jgi:hypothetical protein